MSEASFRTTTTSSGSSEKKNIVLYKNDVGKLLEEHGVKPREEGVQQKMPVVDPTKQQAVPLLANVWGLMTNEGKAYRYDVKVYVKMGKRVVRMVTNPKDDASKIQQRDDFREAFQAIIRKDEYSAVFKPHEGRDHTQEFSFDLSTTMFSRHILDLSKKPSVEEELSDKVTKREGKEYAIFVLSASDEGFRRFKRRFSAVYFCIRQVSSFEVPINSTLSKEVHGQKIYNPDSNTLATVMSSQHVLESPSEFITFDANTAYMFEPANHGFTKNDVPDIGADKYLSLGTRKVVQMIEGPKKGNAPAVIVSCKKTPFYAVEEVLNHVKCNLPRRLTEDDLIRSLTTGMDGTQVKFLHELLKGLYVYSSFDSMPNDGDVPNLGENVYIHKIVSISNYTSHSLKFLVEGHEFTIAEYYGNKYGHNLRFPYAPLAEVIADKGVPLPLSSKDKSSRTIYFPLEILRICDNQRVKNQTPEMISQMIKACAVPPIQNWRNIVNARDSWQFEKCQMLNGLLTRVTQAPMTFTGKWLDAPVIDYGSGQTKVDDYSKWRGGQMPYIKPVTINAWCYYYLSNRPPGSEQQAIRNFLQRYIQMCTNKGIKIQNPVDSGFCQANEEKMSEKFKWALEKGAEFILFIHDDNETAGHSIFKLLERRTEIVTQGVRFRTIQNVFQKGQPLTVENIVNKTNMKMGGLNFSLQVDARTFPHFMDSNTLYIGMQVSKPGLKSKSRNDVLGYSANVLKNPFEFVGDFVYVLGSGENAHKVEAIGNVVKNCLARYKSANGKPPANVIIYRHGCSEGHYELIAKYEVPYIQRMMQDVEGCADVKMALIVHTKLHNAKILKGDMLNVPKDLNPTTVRVSEQNIKPGTVVDSYLVNPKYAEFYLCSHSAIQGTALVPRYTLLYTSTAHSLEQFELMTWNLSFGHQIVNMSVSLPAPAYIANHYAERGRMLLNQSVISSFSDLDTASSDSQDLGLNDLEKKTKELSYRGTQYLSNLRVNA